MVEAFIHGLMEELTKENGSSIICMAMEYTNGKMVEDMKATTKKIRNMVSAFIPGPTDADMRVAGKMANSMEKESTSKQMET